MKLLSIFAALNPFAATGDDNNVERIERVQAQVDAAYKYFRAETALYILKTTEHDCVKGAMLTRALDELEGVPTRKRVDIARDVLFEAKRLGFEDTDLGTVKRAEDAIIDSLNALHVMDRAPLAVKMAGVLAPYSKNAAQQCQQIAAAALQEFGTAPSPFLSPL